VGAGLASGRLKPDSVGPRLPVDSLVRLPFKKARREGRILSGAIPVLDWEYGNVWTDISDSLVALLAPRAGDTLRIRIVRGGKTAWEGSVHYVRTFGDVPEGMDGFGEISAPSARDCCKRRRRTCRFHHGSGSEDAKRIPSPRIRLACSLIAWMLHPPPAVA
jgi:hypothetical protein